LSFRRIALLTLLVLLPALPVVLAVGRGPASDAQRRVIAYTPHNEQIRLEFGRAFADWHRRTYGETAVVVWNTPGGAGDIRRILQANAEAALRDGRAIGGNADIVFGGGSWEFAQLKREITIEVDGERRSGRILESPGFDPAWLEQVYGENSIGGERLYDPDGYWFGTALSAFGIVYNRDMLLRLGLNEPAQWEDLAHARYHGAITMVNPAQSASITTVLEAILERVGWERGWQIIRRMSANARGVASSAPKVSLDVASGDSAAGPSIDFYGRFQAQAIMAAGGGDRMGYVDPKGETVVDADPVALLAGAPDREAAVRFIEFTLSDEGQALWQFRARKRGDGELGPHVFELRRMPIRRSFIAAHSAEFVDQVDPFALATAVPDPDRNARALVAPIFSALCADRRDELARAWAVIRTHPAYPTNRALVTATDVEDARLKALLEAFDAMPRIEGPDGSMHDLATREGRAAVREGWLRGGWKDAGLWPTGAAGAEELRLRLGIYFSGQYARIAGGLE
jgi:iron(III) transport system substrate-binding protein